MCAKDNETNKFYVAQWISHFFDQMMVTTERNDLKVSTTIQELIAKNELGEDCATSPAFQDGRFYIRGKQHLFCIGGQQ